LPGTDGFFTPKRLSHLPNHQSLEAQMALRIMRGMITSGAFNHSRCTAGCDCEPFLYQVNATDNTHIDLARRIGASSAVLLKNDRGVLPLDVATARVALVGSACSARHAINVDHADWMTGDYYVVGGSGRVVSDRAISIRDALVQRGLQVAASLSDDADDALALVETHRATVIVACGGGTTHENGDRPSLRLDQHDLLVSLSRAARDLQRVPPMPPLVVAVMAPGQVATAPWSVGASAVVTLFLAGQETGNAWADVLLGEVNPAGKLPVTFPLDEDDMTPPCEGESTNNCVYTERLDVGWRRLIHKPVGFAFGHGLSYTRFAYQWVARPTLTNAMSSDDANPQGGPHLTSNTSVQVRMVVRVRNTGSVPGAEVAQLYMRYPSSAGEPPLVLRGFAKTSVLVPNEEHDVEFVVDTRGLSFWSAGSGIGGASQGDRGWQIARGEFDYLVGSSSRDWRLNATLHL